MGKASRTLKDNVVANYAINNHDLSENNNDDNKNNIPEKSHKDIHNEKVYDTSLIIYNQLIEYSQNTGVPMCEYVNIKEIQNYVNWMLTT